MGSDIAARPSSVGLSHVDDRALGMLEVEDQLDVVGRRRRRRFGDDRRLFLLRAVPR